MIIKKNLFFSSYLIYILLIFIISRLYLSFILDINMNDLNYGYKLLDYPNLENIREVTIDLPIDKSYYPVSKNSLQQWKDVSKTDNQLNGLVFTNELLAIIL